MSSGQQRVAHGRFNLVYDIRTLRSSQCIYIISCRLNASKRRLSAVSYTSSTFVEPILRIKTLLGGCIVHDYTLCGCVGMIRI